MKFTIIAALFSSAVLAANDKSPESVQSIVDQTFRPDEHPAPALTQNPTVVSKDTTSSSISTPGKPFPNISAVKKAPAANISKV